MARICIITASALGSNPRVVKEADALAAEGHTVHVIAVRNLDLVDARDADVLANAAWTAERIDLRPGPRWRALRAYQLVWRLLARATGLTPDYAHSAMTAALVRAGARQKADLFVAHYVAALPAAARAARGQRVAYGFDAEDFHLGDLSDDHADRFDRTLIRGVEARYLPGCAYLTAASPGIAEAYRREYDLPAPVVVLNAFSKGRAAPSPTSKGVADPSPSVYWFSQTIGADRGLECAVEALALAASRPHLYLRGDVSPGFDQTLKDLSHKHGIGDRLHWLPSAPPSEMEALAGIYDIGLVAENGRTPNHRVALSNKQFTYFLAGLPVVMSDTPGHQAFALEAPGATRLFAAENAASLAAAFDALLGNARALAVARTEAHQLGQCRFNWEIEQEALLRCINLVLANRSVVDRTG